MKFNTLSKSSFINRSSDKSLVSKGFTLIELLVVIAIIAILSGIIIASLTSSKAKSRDAQRVSDLNQIQLAIEQYFSRCGQYPTALDTGLSNGCTGTGVTFASFISVIPKDPSTGDAYGYVVNDGSTPTDYVLHALLEGGSSVQKNSYPNASFANFKSSSNNPNKSPAQITWKSSNNTTGQCYDATAAPLDYCISTK